MVQSSNSSNDNVLRALIEALDPRPPQNALATWCLHQPPAPKPPTQALNFLALAQALAPAPKPPENNLGALFALGSQSSGNALGRVPPNLPGNSLPLNFLGSLSAPQFPATYTPKRRKTFFSFHYADVFRVNNVRNAFKIYNPPTSANLTFFDSSLWESRKLEGDEALKRMIREGVQNTSVVCVLIGSETWEREWVRYEIARSVIDRKGLLAIDINGLNHHLDGTSHTRGQNPLSVMAVGKMRDGTYRLFEQRWDIDSGSWKFGWFRYAKYTGPVDLPEYLPDPVVDHVSALDIGTMRYDFVQQQGHKNIGGWIDLAGARAGR